MQDEGVGNDIDDEYEDGDRPEDMGAAGDGYFEQEYQQKKSFQKNDQGASYFDGAGDNASIIKGAPIGGGGVTESFQEISKEIAVMDDPNLMAEGGQDSVEEGAPENPLNSEIPNNEEPQVEID